MYKRFLGCLGCTGVAAIVVLLFPAAALVGYFMGILPGIFLGLAPSLFVYLVAWWGLRWGVLKIESLAGFDLNARMVRWTANLVAIAIIAAFAIVTPLAINSPLEQQIAELQATDVQLQGTIKLPAIVAVELPKSYAGGKGKPPYCEGLCLRLLFNGVVSRVIAAEIGPDGHVEPASSYRIERRDQCPQPDFTALPIVWPGERWVEKGRPAGMENRVRARISAGECLVREVGRIEDAEAVISFRELKKGLARLSGPWTQSRHREREAAGNYRAGRPRALSAYRSHSRAIDRTFDDDCASWPSNNRRLCRLGTRNEGNIVAGAERTRCPARPSRERGAPAGFP